ncbi:pentatricopeptide repeat-containing protein At2g22070 [Solanum pennellii]|uniref:Pentatricopeptide repeat-containing protein At2g22070 n=1 Tax=Solanum pennellii TaxID=28526 RepID=A0ABM1V7V4_SOLPN|nr:pentatricopeptide repeat-containing protein At2g22070 [Solanum pennellii]XP_015072292.1 pentatricopeptide repeat-containing protein At2g22070 [Solanum pennellii]XP_027771822.1 pentatricopeptide repeat-containing protein At2g22070 [Solanum pennellii]XP_027771823.1 pentatricopeptide repeat-containing protein At2g22070 [Solanum pennellii]XP_027771824.1 pentatricopeptide repeat-containing protein At2g22070 [Solanum pennellii]XP_027771825.1 pentatricopeptide repeat-containing protein At2g22070 [
MDHQNSQSFVSQSHFYVSYLQDSLKSKVPFPIKLIHGRIIKSGIHLSVFLMNNLINGYAKTGFLSYARKVFDVMPVRDTSSWNTLLSGYSKGGLINEAHSIFKEMPYRDSVSWTTMIAGCNFVGRFQVAIQMFLEMVSVSDVSPTQYTCTSVLASCAEIRALNEGRRVHSFVVKFGLSSYVSVANSMLNMYAKSGDRNAAQMVFDGIVVKNTSSWNTLISLYMQTGQVDLALEQFEQMNEHDIVSWNSMITGYNQHGFDVLALSMFSKMLKESSLEPDRYTLASALSACANLGELNVGKQIHAHLIRTEFDTSGAVGNSLICMYSRSCGVDIARRILEKSRESNLNVIAFTSLLDGYIKLGDISPARKIFDSLKDRDVVVWTAMIVGYVQNGFNDDAMELFRLMVKEGPDPNNYTLAAMLSVCSSVASLNHGKQIHSAAIKAGEALSVSVSNALVTMYAKAGNISCARRVFDLIHLNRDTVSWTSMILALAQHGLGAEALQLFENMLAFGMKPDHITYVGVLTACTHVGLVAQGRNYYNMMKEIHGIEPTSSHCACMIDLFGRAGLLEEAQDFIENMPIEPDVIAWGSLLASCRVHKKMELAKVAADRLLSIDPENSGAYSALANVYSACGKWAEAAKIRKSMKDKQVKKEQGFSWIQIKNVVHVFGVEDGLHPQRDAIYKTMEKIWKDIKKMGFIPDTESVLHDLDYEVKEQILRHHSEKLAIAFGLINTPENTTLRIMKNLRVCNDCHSAIKFISKLVGREIILRDATRFHHFKGGFCSCHDYW